MPSLQLRSAPGPASPVLSCAVTPGGMRDPSRQGLRDPSREVPRYQESRWSDQERRSELDPAIARRRRSGGRNRPRRGRDPAPGRVRPMPSPVGGYHPARQSAGVKVGPPRRQRRRQRRPSGRQPRSEDAARRVDAYQPEAETGPGAVIAWGRPCRPGRGHGAARRSVI